jgi:tRNA(Ile)-lysidine synthase
MTTPRPKRLRPFETGVLRTMRERQLLIPGSRVLLAVSGGADSVAMLHAMLALEREMGLGLTCGHVNHQLHAESAGHAAFVGALCDRLRVPFLLREVAVRKRARAGRISLEHAARLERYEALEAMAAECGASHIATAHTATDRAETVLINLLRGTGPEGLVGVPPARGAVVRPLIDRTRSEVEAYLRAKSADHVEDPTNANREPLRNRIRLEVIPMLEDALGRGVVGPLGRVADAALLEREAVLAAEEVLLAEAELRRAPDGSAIVLSVRRLRVMSPGAVSLVLRRAARTVAGEDEAPNLAVIGEVQRLLHSGTGGGEQAGGGCVFRRSRAELRVLRRVEGSKEA